MASPIGRPAPTLCNRLLNASAAVARLRCAFSRLTPWVVFACSFSALINPRRGPECQDHAMISREQREAFGLCLKRDVVKQVQDNLAPAYRVLFSHHLPVL